MAVVWAENSIQKLRSPSIKTVVHLLTYYLRTVIDVARPSLAQSSVNTYLLYCRISIEDVVPATNRVTVQRKTQQNVVRTVSFGL